MNWQDLDDPKPEHLQFCTHCLKPLMGYTSRERETGIVFFKCDCGMEYLRSINQKSGEVVFFPRYH